MPQKLLFYSLYLQLNYRLKKKKQQHCILSQFELFDQQFCLDQIHYLYQMWSVSNFKDDILKIIPSNEPKIIQKYLEDYYILI